MKENIPLVFLIVLLIAFVAWIVQGFASSHYRSTIAQQQAEIDRLSKGIPYGDNGLKQKLDECESILETSESLLETYKKGILLVEQASKTIDYERDWCRKQAEATAAIRGCIIPYELTGDWKDEHQKNSKRAEEIRKGGKTP